MTAMVSRPHGLKDQFHGDHETATGTGRVTGTQEIGLLF